MKVQQKNLQELCNAVMPTGTRNFLTSCGIKAMNNSGCFEMKVEALPSISNVPYKVSSEYMCHVTVKQ